MIEIRKSTISHVLKLLQVCPSIQHLRTGAKGTQIITFCKFITKRVA